MARCPQVLFLAFAFTKARQHLFSLHGEFLKKRPSPRLEPVDAGAVFYQIFSQGIFADGFFNRFCRPN
jgi:hypothetical protein